MASRFRHKEREDEKHSPAFADSHSILLVARVPDSSQLACRSKSGSALPMINTKASAVNASPLHH
jgi:hypothetical protein